MTIARTKITTRMMTRDKKDDADDCDGDDDEDEDEDKRRKSTLSPDSSAHKIRHCACLHQ